VGGGRVHDGQRPPCAGRPGTRSAAGPGQPRGRCGSSGGGAPGPAPGRIAAHSRGTSGGSANSPVLDAVGDSVDKMREGTLPEHGVGETLGRITVREKVLRIRDGRSEERRVGKGSGRGGGAEREA